MDLTSGYVFTLDKVKYVILTDLVMDNKHYLFVNKMLNKDCTNDFYCLEEENGEIKFVYKEDLLNKLLPIFQQKILELKIV